MNFFKKKCWVPGMAWDRSGSKLVHFERDCVRFSCVLARFSVDFVVKLPSGGVLGWPFGR